MPKIVKSSSSTEKPKMETLHSPNQGISAVVKSHEDSDNNKSKSSYISKVSSTSILTETTEISKRSAKSNTNDFYPKNFNHAFLTKPDFEG